VLVDEYQDTSASQYCIAQAIAQGHGNLCVTGDPDQSIYGWRGADINNILSFERDYPGARVVRLEQNYRSTKRILAAANVIIAFNAQRKEKALWTENPDGPEIRIWEVEDGADEAAEVARDIKRLVAGGIAPGEVAVFYRINSLSRVLEEAFLHEGVAYQIARGVEFYNRKEIKDVLAYLRVLVNPADEVSLLRVINTPTRGIGDTTVERLVIEARHRGCRLFDVITGDSLPESVGRAAGKVMALGALFGELAKVLEQPPADALRFVISHSGLQAFYRDERRADETASSNLDELINAAAAFEQTHPDASLVEWIEHAALVSDVDSVQGEGGPVTLMTLHAAKGLEFQAVYMIGVEEGLLPLKRDGEVEDEEEERRLCFVGMTRAKERLTLSHARYRMMRGVTERTIRSPYLDELNRAGIQSTPSEPQTARRRTVIDRGRLPADIAHWEVGSLVRHPNRGVGQILSLERRARRTHVSVLFESGQRQSFVLEFADLERVDYHDVG
jgi:ATP-dependent DNA helicase UvrD/PcrA